MPLRSWMFVPGDSEVKLSKVMALGADVVIVDLEDAVAPEAKSRAREMTAGWLAEQRRGGSQLWVRINPLDGDLWRQDLSAVMPSCPDGIVVPKASGPDQLETLASELCDLEQREGIATGSTLILPLVSETPRAALTVADYATRPIARLLGLTWGAEDLSAAIGASRKRDEAGEWTDLFRMVRAATLLTAHAAGISAIDTLHADFRDLDRLGQVARASYLDGFAGMLAIHPSQVAVINTAFSPSSVEREWAQRIVDAFAAQPGIGTLQLDGKMIDQPHLEQARRLLRRAG